MANFQEVENTVLDNNLKNRCIKKDYEGIHDRFLRDDVFRRRMIENNGDEKVCRAWDVLADEDHTYHLSEQEYFYCKNIWWLHSTKSGSNTLPLRNRSDFKHALSTSKRLHQEAGGEQIEPDSVLEVQTKEIGIEFLLYLVFGKIPGGLPENSKKKVKKDEANKGL